MTPGCDRNIGAPDTRQDTAADFAISEDAAVHTLANGLRVVHSCDEATAMVCLDVLYGVGGRDEDPGQTGIAHMYEHLMLGP